MHIILNYHHLFVFRRYVCIRWYNRQCQYQYVLNIADKPKVHALLDKKVTIGNNVSVQCTTTLGNPQTTSYLWTRDIDGWSQITSTMALVDIRTEDTGVYKCTVQNIMDPTGQGLVSGVDSKQFTLTVVG